MEGWDLMIPILKSNFFFFFFDTDGGDLFLFCCCCGGVLRVVLFNVFHHWIASCSLRGEVAAAGNPSKLTFDLSLCSRGLTVKRKKKKRVHEEVEEGWGERDFNFSIGLSRTHSGSAPAPLTWKKVFGDRAGVTCLFVLSRMRFQISRMRLRAVGEKKKGKKWHIFLDGLQRKGIE